MNGPTILFCLLQAISPGLGMLGAYAHAYQRRIQGVSGRELEADLARIGFLLTACFSLVCFWGWPESPNSWSKMPGFRQLCQLVLGSAPQDDPSYESFKLICSASTAALLGVVARLGAFGLNRRLVRSVPRYYHKPVRPVRPVGKR